MNVLIIMKSFYHTKSKAEFIARIIFWRSKLGKKTFKEWGERGQKVTQGIIEYSIERIKRKVIWFEGHIFIPAIFLIIGIIFNKYF